MKNKITLLIIVMLTEVSIPAFAQAPSWLWAKKIGGPKGEYSNTIAIDSWGNLHVAGYFTNTADFDPGPGTFNMTTVSVDTADFFIAKYDEAGNFIWAKQWGSHENDNIQKIALDAEGNIYGTGVNNADTLDFDPGPGVFNLLRSGFALKLDSSGNLLWAGSIGGSAHTIAVDTNGINDVYITGAFCCSWQDFDPGPAVYNLTPVSINSNDIFVLKLDSAGNFRWAKSAGSTANNEAGDAIALDQGGTRDIITGGRLYGTADFDPGPATYTINPAGDQNIFLWRLDSAGNFVWAEGVGSGYTENCQSITVDLAGCIYITGHYEFTTDFDPGPAVYNLSSVIGSYDAFILKLTASGNFIWAKSVGGSNWEFGHSNTVDASGNIYTTGRLFSSTADFDPGPATFNLTAQLSDIYVLKLDSSGNFKWAVKAGGNHYEHSASIALNASGYVYVTGIYKSYLMYFGTISLTNADFSNTWDDVFIAKLDTFLTFPTSINAEGSFGNGIFVFPNPATTELIITNAEFGIESVEIWDVVGERVKRLTPALSKGEGVRVDVSSLSAGIYFVKVKTKKGVSAAKFVKQ